MKNSPHISKIIIHELLNLFKASQAIIIIFPYYIMLGVLLSIISLIIFKSPDPMTLINYILGIASPDYIYPKEDTALIIKAYSIITVILYILTLLYQKIRKTDLPKWTAKKKIKIHLIALGFAYLLFMIIILPKELSSEIFTSIIIYTVLYIILGIMIIYYFSMTEFISRIQQNILSINNVKKEDSVK